MNAAAKKADIAHWVLGLTDENVIKLVADSISEIRSKFNDKDTVNYFSSFAEINQRKFDFDLVKAEQKVTPFRAGELDLLIKEADIQESIEVLLASNRIAPISLGK